MQHEDVEQTSLPEHLNLKKAKRNVQMRPVGSFA